VPVYFASSSPLAPELPERAQETDPLVILPGPGFWWKYGHPDTPVPRTLFPRSAYFRLRMIQASSTANSMGTAVTGRWNTL